MTVAGSVVATDVDLNGDADVSGTLTLSGGSQPPSPLASTSLSISSGQFVDVESIRFTELQLASLQMQFIR